MRIVYCGSGAFGVATFEGLLASEHEIVLVFTQPDRQAGRGRHVRTTPIKDAAVRHGIPVAQPAKLRDGTALAALREADPDVAVVVAYGHLIPGDMLRVPPHGFVNLHASLLPKYRGAAPVPHAILNGEAETGVTVFRLNERFDEGDILMQASVPIGPKDTSATILEALAPLGANLMLKVLGEFAAGWDQPVPQVGSDATKAPKLTKEQGKIDWSLPRARIDGMVRAFQPWPLAHTFFDGKGGRARLTVLDADPAPDPRQPPPPGTVLRCDGKTGLIVMAGDGPLKLCRVKPEGKRAMDGAAFAVGARLEPGAVLG